MSEDFESEPVEQLSTDQLLEKDRLRAALRTRAAMTVVAVIFLSIILCCAAKLADIATLRVYLYALAVAVFGVVLVLTEPKSDSQQLNELRILRFYSSKRFYGIVFAITAVTVIIFAFVTAEPVRAKSRPAPVEHIPQGQPAAVATNPPPAAVMIPEMPHLKVTGMILNGPNSTALINGRTIRLGDSIEEVRLVEVCENYIEVEFYGERRYVPRADLIAQPAVKPAAPQSRTPRH